MEPHLHYWAMWWLIFPLIWFAYGLIRMGLRHHRHKKILDVIGIYAAAGKEPPADLLEILRHGHHHHGQGQRRWILTGCLAIAFGLLAYFGSRPGFTIPAVILAAVSVGIFLSRRPVEHHPPRGGKSHRHDN